MEQEVATLLSALAPHSDATLLRLRAPRLASQMQPGQFVMVKPVGVGWDPFLRSPLFVADVAVDEGLLTLWLPHGSPSLEPLLRLPLSSRLDLLGPCGAAVTLNPAWRQLLLVAEGLALGPLLALLHHALRRGLTVTLLSITPPGHVPYPADALPFAIEYQRAERGGAGQIAQPLLRWADGVVAAGSTTFYADLADELRDARPGQRGGFAYGLLLEPFGWQPGRMAWGEPRVACATGSCRACLVPVRRDSWLACTRGPAIDLWGL